MKKLYRLYVFCLMLLLLIPTLTIPAFAVEDMWTVANKIIVDVYGKIAGISTVLAGLMSAVAVVGAKLSNNQHIRYTWSSGARGIGCMSEHKQAKEKERGFIEK